MRKLAGWCYDHRWIVVGAWIVALVALIGIHSAAGDAYKDDFKLSGTESADAQNLLMKAAPAAAGDIERVVFETKSGKITDPANSAAISQSLANVAKAPHVVAVHSPLDAAGSTQISASGTIAYATVNLDVQAIKVSMGDAKALVDAAKAGNSADLKVAIGGQVAQSANPQSVGGVGIGVLAALLVLFLAFGINWAAVTPMLTAGLSLTAGLQVIGLLSHAMTIATFSGQLSELIGLGVGVDYALFIVTRTRQGLRRGLDPRRAVVDALDTSGRAVMFAGVTVAIALLGMFALGVSFLYGVAISATIAVLFTVLAALTFLPAFLAIIGKSLTWSVIPSRRRNRITGASVESARWAKWAAMVQRKPAAFAALGTILIVVLALPFFSLRLGTSDQGNDPKSTPTRQAYDLLAAGFGPGFNGPLQLITPLPNATDQAVLDRTITKIQTTEDVAAVGPTTVLPAKDGNPAIAIVNVFPKGSPQDKSTTDLVHRLRDNVIKPSVADSGTRIYVGGQTAIIEDFSKVLSGKLPLFVGVVVLLSFLLLMAVFRSLLVPLVAAVMNLLSIGAAFGVIVAVFQYGWLADLIGVSRPGPIEAFVPVLMFAILFGLSMDYEVFLVSRIYEEWHRRKDNSEAVTHGMAATGRTISAAAAIMVLVFAAFMLGDNRVIKLFGLGLASAVLLDALIIRSLLVPALMHVIGDNNWKIPRAIDRILPRLNVEGSAHLEDEVPDPPAGEKLLEPV